MPATKTNVFNRAATFLGSERFTSYLDEKGAARIMREIYDETLDYMLEQHPWSFAKASTELALIGDADIHKGWKLEYALPVDFLNVVSVNNDNSFARSIEYYEVMGDRLYSDEAPLYLKYTKRETTVGRFSAKFVNAFSYALARDVAKALTEETGLIEFMERKAEQSLAEAKAMDQRKQVLPSGYKTQYPTYNSRRTPWQL